MEGYALVGPATVSCRSSQWLSPPPQCKGNPSFPAEHWGTGKLLQSDLEMTQRPRVFQTREELLSIYAWAQGDWSWFNSKYPRSSILGFWCSPELVMRDLTSLWSPGCYDRVSKMLLRLQRISPHHCSYFPRRLRHEEKFCSTELKSSESGIRHSGFTLWLCHFKVLCNVRCWWLTPMILATRETEIRMIVVWDQPGEIFKTPSPK
jgi:hypothetical protein